MRHFDLQRSNVKLSRWLRCTTAHYTNEPAAEPISLNDRLDCAGRGVHRALPRMLTSSMGSSRSGFCLALGQFHFVVLLPWTCRPGHVLHHVAPNIRMLELPRAQSIIGSLNNPIVKVRQGRKLRETGACPSVICMAILEWGLDVQFDAERLRARHVPVV